MTFVTLYGRPGCHLCEDARRVIERVRADLGFAFELRDIERDDALLHAYLVRIPVVTIDGSEVFELDELTEQGLRERLDRVDAQ